MNPFENWLSTVTSGATVNAVSNRTGLPQSSLARQIREQTVPAASVVKIARTYDALVIPGLVAAGIIEQSDVEALGTKGALVSATDFELSEEMLRRAARREGKDV